MLNKDISAMSQSVRDYRDLASKTLTLISQPDVYQRAMSLLDDSDTSAEELTQVVECDPGITGQLLKVANRQGKRFSGQIDTVSDAINAISKSDLRGILLATSPKRVFENVPTELVDVDDFWFHSLCCALSAQLLARKCNLVHEKRLFVTGLLHDIGHLPIYNQCSECARHILDLVKGTEQHRHGAEKKVLGFSHADVGAELMRLWGFPANLSEPVAFHHEPQKADRFPLETAIVHISTNLVNIIEPSWKPDGNLQESLRAIDPHVWSVTKLSQDDMQTVLTEVKMLSFSIMDDITPDIYSLY